MFSHEFADASSGCSTTSGTIPPKAGWKKPSARPNPTASVAIAVSVRLPEASSAKNAATTAQRARSDADHEQPPGVPVREDASPEQRREERGGLDASTNPSDPPSSVTRQPSATRKAASPTNEIVCPLQSSRKSRLSKAAVVARTRQRYPRLPMLRAVVFDVDFTIAKPGPDLGPEGYRRLGERFGLDLDPSRYAEARAAAIGELKRHPELDHDEEIWVLFTERIVQLMGGVGNTYECAAEMTRAWLHAQHFELYDDALPTLDALRARGLKLGLLSNTSRDLADFVAHHGIEVDAVLTSHVHGKTKPHETIFRALLAQLDVAAEDAVMIGDQLEDDVLGARAVGMRAILVDRDGRYPDVDDRLDDLRGLPAALGLA